jgi:hypothetical protein
VASIGDLTNRDPGGGEPLQAAFWDADQAKFSLDLEVVRCGNLDPKWLRIDSVSGVLSGSIRREARSAKYWPFRARNAAAVNQTRREFRSGIYLSPQMWGISRRLSGEEACRT